MALQRRRSVPMELLPVSPEPSQSNSFILSSSAPTLLSQYVPPPAPASQTFKPINNKFMSQAEALASMTFELGLRNLNTLALRLERDVQRLVINTADDQDFRRENEARLTRMMREVEAVKAHMAHFEGKPPVTRAEIDRLQQEMSQTLREWKAEVADIRVKLDALDAQIGLPKKAKRVEGNNQTSSALEPSAPSAPSAPPTLPALPALSATQTLPPRQSTLRMETRAMRRERLEVVLNRQQQFSVSSSHEHRITETINSTKRWNREHKVTKCSGPEFIANYLMKQGRRDPDIAKVLQQAIQKRAFQGINMETGEPWCPHNLKELCHSVTWRDVIDAATEVLVTKRHRTVQLLKQM